LQQDPFFICNIQLRTDLSKAEDEKKMAVNRILTEHCIKFTIYY